MRRRVEQLQSLYLVWMPASAFTKPPLVYTYFGSSLAMNDGVNVTTYHRDGRVTVENIAHEKRRLAYVKRTLLHPRGMET